MASRVTKIGPQSIAGLRPGEMIWDTELKRFGARKRYANGSTIFFVKAQIHRRQRWITLGRLGPLTPADARTKARQMLALIDSGGDPTRVREMQRGMPTVSEFAERWLTEHVALKRKRTTHLEYRRMVDKHIVPSVGRLPIDQVDQTDAIQLHTALANHRYAANRVLGVLSALMSYAELVKLRSPRSNPCSGVERFRESKRRRPLAVSELTLLWARLGDLGGTEGPYVVAALRLLLLTGMRKSEVLTLRWTDVDLAARTIELKDAKTGPRTVILSQYAVAILASLPRQAANPYVIVGDREGRHLINLQKPWDRVRRALGFPDVRIHDLRHTMATMLARSAPLVVVRDALGHQVIETTSGYSHAANDDVRAAVDELALAIAGHQ